MVKRKKKRNPLKATENPRPRAELLDYDYLDQLDTKSLNWLKQFSDEYVSASIEKKKNGKPKKKYIHTKPEHIKSIYDANNWRNNDVYGVSRANNLLSDVNSLAESNDGWYITNTAYTEDSIIANLDSNEQNELLNVSEYFSCRDRYPENEILKKDKEIMVRYKMTEEHFYLLKIVHDADISTKKKIEQMANSYQDLLKYVEKSDFFKTKNDGSNNG